MARRPSTPESTLKMYDSYLRSTRNITEATRHFYRGHTQIVMNMLRRTFGRTMWRDGVKIETISAMLGHDSIEQTLEYIGANIDDMQSAMDMFSLG